MSHPDPATQTDPELEALPEPRRPWRRVTLAAMAMTLVGSLALAILLTPQIEYSLSSSTPLDLGDLSQAQLSSAVANRWVHGYAALDAQAIAYQRPLDDAEYRLIPLTDTDQLWIELRIPHLLDASSFIPPTSFVGRLVPLQQAGLGYDTLAHMHLHPGLTNGWLLLDGESPQGTRWVLGVLLLLVGFAGFASWGLFRVLRKTGAAA